MSHCVSLLFSFSDMQDPVTCPAGPPHGSPYSSHNSRPAAPQPTILSQIAKDFSSVDHPDITQSPTSPDEGTYPLSPQSSTSIAFSPVKLPPQSGSFSSPTPLAALLQTQPSEKSSLSSPTAPVLVKGIETSQSSDKKGNEELLAGPSVVILTA